jgi:hypothetical protein
MTGELVLVERSGYLSERVKTRINRRGDCGEGRERKGDCVHVGAIHPSVVQVVSQGFAVAAHPSPEHPIIKTRSI